LKSESTYIGIFFRAVRLGCYLLVIFSWFAVKTVFAKIFRTTKAPYYDYEWSRL